MIYMQQIKLLVVFGGLSFFSAPFLCAQIAGSDNASVVMHQSELESKQENKEGKEKAHVASDAQKLDQDFLEKVVEPALTEARFSIEHFQHERLAKLFLYLGCVDHIERPSMFKTHSEVVLAHDPERVFRCYEQELYDKAREGALLKMLDSMTLATAEQSAKQSIKVTA